MSQTSDLRPDGSLRQSDIACLLRSKFGVALTDEEVEEVVLGGLSLGGQLVGGSSDDGSGAGTFDLAEIVAALVVPELLWAAEANGGGGDSEDDHPPPDDVLEVVLESIQKKVFGGSQQDVIVTSESVKQILVSLGETELAHNNDLIYGMVEQASGDDPESDDPTPFNVVSLARALTKDLLAYKNGGRETYPNLGNADPKDLFCCKRHHRLASGEGESQTKTESISGGDNEEAQGRTEKKVEEIACGSHGGGDTPKIETAVASKTAPTKDETDKSDGYQVKTIITTKSIDYCIDAQSSRCVAVTLWMFFLLHLLASGSLGLQDFPSLVPSDLEQCPDTAHLGCDTLEIFLSWVDSVFTLTIVGGIFIMSIGSLGNSASTTSRILVITSLVPVLYFFIKPFTSIGTSPSDLSGSPQRQFALGLSMVVALLIVGERIRQFMHLFVVPKHWFDSRPQLMSAIARGFTGSEHERLEAASYKMTRFLRNACDISREGQNDEQTKHVLFHEKDEAVEKIGGHRWVWKKMWNKSLFCEEGVRFSARLVAANVMQFAIIVYVILYMLQLTARLVEEHEDSPVLVLIRSGEEAANSILSGLEDLSGIAQAFLDTAFGKLFPALESLRVDSCDALASAANEKGVNATLPSLCSSNSTFLNELEEQSAAFKALVLASMGEKAEPMRAYLHEMVSAGADTLADVSVVVDPVETWHIQMAFGIGGLVAFIASIFLATLYLPSVAATTLKYRSGVFPSLANPRRFTSVYRGSQHSVTYLTGAIFWGTLLYTIVLSGVIAVLILIAVWISAIYHETEMPAPGPWGWVLGSLLAFVFQYIIFNVTTCHMYKAFYRKRPGRANVHHILWEAAWIGLSVLFVVMRGIKLAIVAALSIGRIDVPFLAEGVGVYSGIGNLDSFPDIFRKDILAHEAHNHPYIERLSKIYLLKIADPEFATSAGTAWRLVFVLSLCPWLGKYRRDARVAK